jgi:hypothetical protein
MLISLLLSLLLSMVAATAWGQSPQIPPPEPTPQERHLSAAAAQIPKVESVLRLLPTPPGLARTGDVEIYTVAKLSDHLDGGAEVYRQYGAVETGTVSFTRPGVRLPLITVDLHRFGEPKNAFGIFRLERSEHAEEIKLGGEAAWQSGLLTLWQGPFYARIVSGASRDSTLGCARDLLSLLPTSGDTLNELGLFPRASTTGTERWIPHAFLGIKGLDDVWTATCQDSAGTFQVLFRRNRPPLSDAEVGKAGKITTRASNTSPIEMIDLRGDEKGKVLLLFYKKMARYAAGYVGPKPNNQRASFISHWVDQLPLWRQ